MQDRLEKHRKMAAKRKQQQEEEENDLDKNDLAAKQEEEDTAVAREGWTPNSAATMADHTNTNNTNTNADDVTIASQVSSIDWGGAGAGVPQSALSSRRSSLKSMSAIELDVVGGADTPGPEHTVEPLQQMDEAAQQQQGGTASKVGKKLIFYLFRVMTYNNIVLLRN